MTLNHAYPQTLHWMWAGLFVFLGIFVVAKELFGGEGSFHAADRETLRRLDEAFDRRHEPEGPSRVRAFRWGAASIILAILAAFTQIQFIILYDMLCLLGAAFSAASYLQLRNSADKRVAISAPRKTTAVVPAYWFAAFAIAGLSILVYARAPQFTLSSLLVCASTLVTTLVGWRVTPLRAILSGVDIPAEHVVDDRMRFMRSASTLVLASVQPAAFCWQAMAPFDFYSPQFAVCILSLGVFIGYGLWFFAKRAVALRISTTLPTGVSVSQ
jgi:hypothetical protein